MNEFGESLLIKLAAKKSPSVHEGYMHRDNALYGFRSDGDRQREYDKANAIIAKSPRRSYITHGVLPALGVAGAYGGIAAYNGGVEGLKKNYKKALITGALSGLGGASIAYGHNMQREKSKKISQMSPRERKAALVGERNRLGIY